MQYRINKNWTPYAVITAVTVNVATTLKGRARQEAIENIGDPETRKASRHSPKKTAEACAAAVEAWLIEMLQAEVVPKKHLKMLRTTGGDLASWLYEFGKKKETAANDRSEENLDSVHDDNSTSTTEDGEKDESNEEDYGDAGPDDTSTPPFPASLEDEGGVRLRAVAARRAVRLQKRAYQRPEGEAKGKGCVYAWFGEGFLYIGYAALRRSGTQSELAGPAYRWQEHLVNHAREDTAEADQLRYRMAKRKSLGELQYMIVQEADVPEARLMESTAIATISPNANGRRTKRQNADTRRKAQRRRPRYRARTIVPYVSQGIWDQRGQKKRTKRDTTEDMDRTATKLVLPNQAPPLKVTHGQRGKGPGGGKKA